MIIQCKSCNFGTRTRAEGLYLRAEDIKYCMNCGSKFSDAGLNVNVRELLSAGDKQQSYYQNILLFYISCGVFLTIVVMLALLTLYPNVNTQYLGLIMIATIASLIPYVLLVARLADKKAKNKFPISSN